MRYQEDRLGHAAIPARARTHPWFLLAIRMSVRADGVRELDVDACIRVRIMGATR